MPSTSESRIKKNQESERVLRRNMNQTERKVKTLFGNRYIMKENISWVDGRGRLVQADAKKNKKTTTTTTT